MNDGITDGLNFLGQEVWTKEEIKEMDEKARKEREMKEEDIDKPIPFEVTTEIETKRQKAIDQLTLMAIEDAKTILALQEIVGQWKRMFITLLTVFLLLEGAWILLYLIK